MPSSIRQLLYLVSTTLTSHSLKEMELTQMKQSLTLEANKSLFMGNSYETFLGMQSSVTGEASEPHEINPFRHN